MAKHKLTKLQIIYSQPKKILVGRYLSPKGERLVSEGLLTKEQADAKYGKNRYTIDPNAQPIKMIKHRLNHQKLSNLN